MAGWVGAAIAAVGTGVSIHQGNRAASDREQAAIKQEKQATARAVRERREILRQARIKRAQIVNQSTLTGTNTSSSAQSAAGAIGNQAASNVGSSFATQALSQQASNFMQSAANAQTRGSQAGQLASLGSSFIKPNTGGGGSKQSQINKNWGYDFRGDPFST